MLIEHALAGSRDSATHRGRAVTRSRLLSALQGQGDARVVLVSGPAGSGKSTLVRQWSDADSRLHVKVPLAAHLDDPAVLAAALVSALERIGPSEPGAAAALTAQEPSFSSVVVPGMADLAASRATGYVLVLDDVHLLHDPGCWRLLRALASGVPEGSAVALVSREAGPDWLSRFRAEGRLAELSAADLAFDIAEADELLAGLGLPRREQVRDDLLDASEGWAVALYLLGLAQRDQRRALPTQGVAPAARGPEFVDAYIRSEVLDPLSAIEREFLLRTSILDEQDPDVCDAVLGRDDSAVVLHDLGTRIALVRRRDADAHVYRYHHLLTDALRRDLAATSDALTIASLHARASRCYAERGDLDAAVRHARLARDHEALSHLVWAGVPASVGSGRSDALARWIADLPESDLADDRWLSLAAAWSGLQTGDLDLRDRWTLRSEAHAGRDWQGRAGTDQYAASVAVLEALVGARGLPQTVDLARRSLDGLAPDDPFRAASAFLLGVGLTLLREPDAEDALAEALRLSRALDVPVILADSLAFQGMLAILGGELSAGIAHIDESARVLEEFRLERLATAAHTVTAYALALALRQDRDRARTKLATARRLTESIVGLVPWFHVLGPVVQARTALLLGDVSLARLLVGQARGALTDDLVDTLAGELLLSTEEAVRATADSAASAATLTAAELRVLQFLPSHLTFPQIGEHLFLSASTVKTHALAIYRKLGVSSRDDAVTTARELGLVEAPLRG